MCAGLFPQVLYWGSRRVFAISNPRMNSLIRFPGTKVVSAMFVNNVCCGFLFPKWFRQCFLWLTISQKWSQQCLSAMFVAFSRSQNGFTKYRRVAYKYIQVHPPVYRVLEMGVGSAKVFMCRHVFPARKWSRQCHQGFPKWFHQWVVCPATFFQHKDGFRKHAARVRGGI